MEPPSSSSGIFDVAIVGAGPVGLAMAIELARLGLDTIVLDRRPPLDRDARVRPQLLVARAGDLAHLAHLGVEIAEPTLVSPLATRTERDRASGRLITGAVPAFDVAPPRAPDLRTLASQPPIALVPIGRLQRALLGVAARHGTTVRYGCEVVRLRRHARAVSLACADGATLTASIAIIATGAARSLASAVVPGFDTVVPEQRVIAGVFAGGERGRWVRLEVPLPGFDAPARCTMLETPADSHAGTALLVDVPHEDADESLHQAFETASRALGLHGAPFVVSPQVFTTAATAATRRFVAGDGRAPVVIAGDAAQTGHVFSGQTCFVNVALALGLCAQLRHARTALVERKLASPALVGGLARYGAQSEIGAALLAQASRRFQVGLA